MREARHTRHESIRLEAQVHLREVEDSSGHESGAREQNGRARHLTHHEEPLRPSSAIAAAGCG
jgi:hypothetical protein